MCTIRGFACLLALWLGLVGEVQGRKPKPKKGTPVAQKAQETFCTRIHRRYKTRLMRAAYYAALPRARRAFWRQIRALDRWEELAPHCFRDASERALLRQKDRYIGEVQTRRQRALANKARRTPIRLKRIGWGMLLGGYGVQTALAAAIHITASSQSATLPDAYGLTFVPVVGFFLPFATGNFYKAGLAAQHLQTYAALAVSLPQVVGVGLLLVGYAKARRAPSPPAPAPGPKRGLR